MLLELCALLDDDIANRGRGVLGMERAEHDVVLYLDLLIVIKGDQFVWRFLALKVLEPVHHSSDIGFNPRITDDRAWAHPLKVAL